jgi:peptidoglycan/xylan/chitin deacetylase (PgdA/CDA1 family)
LKRRLLITLLSLAALGTLWSEVRFAGPDLSGDNLLLFEVRSESPQWGPHDTLFLADLESRELTQLTHFPERLTYLAGIEALQLQNRFGVFYSDATLGHFQPSSLFPSFVRENSVLQGSLSPLSAAPNGRYVLYLERKSPAFGDLYFIDLARSERSLVSAGIEIDLSTTPVVWAPDSSFFVYSKKGIIYYMSVRQLAEQGRLAEDGGLAEEYRQIGEGQIGNMSPGSGASLYYLTGSLIYELDSSELFTRALYRGYLAIGRLVGKIPFSFDPNFDSFWISPAGTHVLLDKGGRNLFLYRLSTEDFSSTGASQSLPYLYLPRNTQLRRVLWDEAGCLTILTAGSENGREKSQTFRIEAAGMDSTPAFQRLDMEGVEDILLSPDRSQAAVVFRNRVVIQDYRSWSKKLEFPHPRVVQIAWVGEGQLVIAGENTIQEYSLDNRRGRLLGISQADDYGFAGEGNAVVSMVGDKTLQWQFGDLSSPVAWSESTGVILRSKNTTADSYRVFLEETPNRVFQNMLMVRDRERRITTALLKHSPGELEPFPEADDPLDFVTFDHGSRIRRREISLVFNVLDSVEGLPAILSALREYNLRCTFFVNGEAIRSYPDAVREIAESGHEVGSLFSMYFDMTDARFRLGKEFIKRGMAQNEDEYFAATGKELSLLWHAPYYFVNSDILQASREMNYVYVGRDVDPLDWVTREMRITTRDIYFPAGTLVERVIATKKPGSIVPVMVGKPNGERQDYFFHKLDLLIDALVKRGYDIVPVSVLIEHAE